MASENLLIWIVRGLHSDAHHNAIRDLVISERLSMVCLQETKLDVITDFDVIQILGSGFNYDYLPIVQTRGGILLGWCNSAWVVANPSTRSYSICARVRLASGGPEWWLSTVYGLSHEANKPAFLAELHYMWQVHTGA
jgi:hypothetical protein